MNQSQGQADRNGMDASSISLVHEHHFTATGCSPALNGVRDVIVDDPVSFTFFPSATASSTCSAPAAAKSLNININFVSSGAISASNKSHRRRQFTRTKATSDISSLPSSLSDLVASSNLGCGTFSPSNIPAPANLRIPSATTPQSDVTQPHRNGEEDLNPFSTSPQPSPFNSVMFPSLTSVIDNLLEDKSPKVDVDPLGCAVLPASEYALTIESDCKFHYSFWDAYDHAHFLLPVDLSLHVDPTCVHLYEYHALAMPSVSQIAIRFGTFSLQTRFPRLLPKPCQSIPSCQHRAPDALIFPPNHAYTVTYRGAVIKPPSSSQKKSERTEISIVNGIHLASGWDRIVSYPAPLGLPSLSNLKFEAKSAHGGALLLGKQKERRGFTLRAWIPVPVSLFMVKETCTFRLEARVWIEDPFTRTDENGQNLPARARRFRQSVKCNFGYFDDELSPGSSAGNHDERMLEASAHVTVSHLQSLKEMV